MRISVSARNTPTLMNISRVTILPEWYALFRSFITLISILSVIARSFSPIFNQDKTKQHSAQVGKVSNVISRPIGNTREKFNSTVSDYKIFCFDRNREKQKHKSHIGKHHPKREQN